MKTEKRLTMALSVLVALMMLAVPLASSSNLFVDGGQTNSNGDAPLLGADAPGEGYTITFKLNSDGKSLDAVVIDALPKTIDVPSVGAAGGVDAVAVTWYQNEKGDLCALVTDERITVQKLINALYSANGSSSLITKGKYGDAGANTYAYNLTSWKDANSGVLYLYKTLTDPADDTSPAITKDMTFDAQWLLNKECVEIPVKVTFDGETKDYVKAYPYKANTENTQVTVDPTFFNGADVTKIMEVSIYGQSVNPTDLSKLEEFSNYNPKEEVYTYTIKDAKDVDLSSAKDIVVADNTIIINYTLKSTYSKVVVSSVMFKEDVVMYTKNNTPFTYLNVYYALQNVTNDSGKKIFVPSTEGISTIDGSALVNDGSYKITSWNDNVPLDSAVYATSPLTLNATLNSYKVVFMVNGDYEIVTVNYGELSENKCPFDVPGLSGWVMTDDYAKFNDFYFTDANIAGLEKKVTDGKGEYVPVFIAVFTAEPIYAVFDAVKNNDGNFGDKAVTKIVIPVKADSTIQKPTASPVYKEKTLFLGWTGYDASKKASEYVAVDGVITFKADVETYDHILSFYVDGEISAKLYYNGTLAVGADGKVDISKLVAFEYEGMIYAVDPKNADSVDKALKALQPKKDGYAFTQWNDKDGKKVFSVSVSFTDNIPFILFETGDGYPKDGVKTDMDFYGQFDAKSYTIEYVNTLGGAGASQTDGVVVDKEITLLGENALLNENYTLIGWSTVPGAGGDEYKLGGTFVLSGADYEKLANASADGKVVVKLYSVWQSNGSNVPGDNTDGGDNTASYAIAAMLGVLVLVGIAALLLLKKKN